MKLYKIFAYLPSDDGNQKTVNDFTSNDESESISKKVFEMKIEIVY